MNRRQVLGTLATGAWAVTPRWARASGPSVPAVRLLDHTGQAHELQRLCAGPVAIGFFYTGCSTVCPPQTAALRDLRQRLDAAPARERSRARILSITVDPLADAPAAIEAYAERFGVRLGLDAGWLMLTGQPAMLSRVWRAFGVPTDDPAAHSSLLWLGSMDSGRWTRAAALTPTARLAELLAGVAS